MLCDENAICTNIYEGYNCDCKKGFKGDGFKCEGKTHGFPLVMLQYFFIVGHSSSLHKFLRKHYKYIYLRCL